MLCTVTSHPVIQETTARLAKLALPAMAGHAIVQVAFYVACLYQSLSKRSLAIP